VTGLWVAVLVASLGCYALKLAGLSVPERVLARPVVQRVADLVPVVMLAALVAVQTLTTGERIVLDARLAGLAVGVAALLLRATFLVVVAAAALTAALVRLL
jgi:branched-subunit amino acid transport protein